MTYSPYRFTEGFDGIQRMAGACKIEASKGEEALSCALADGYSDAIRAAMLAGAAQALYAIAPLVTEPDEGNIVAMVTGFIDSIPHMAEKEEDDA